MSAPLLIPASRDPGDTRPDASGRVPGVHYNVPMYQPLQTQQGFDPNAALLNILSNGSYMHGGSMTQGWTGQAVGAAQSFDPRTPAGAVNLLSILVPGAGKGRPTPAQGDLLRAINRSSYDNSIGMQAAVYRNGSHYPGFHPNNESVKALMDVIGSPAKAFDSRLDDSTPYALRPAANPLHAITSDVGMSKMGVFLDATGVNPNMGKTIGDSRMQAFLRSIARNNIQRRN